MAVGVRPRTLRARAWLWSRARTALQDTARLVFGEQAELPRLEAVSRFGKVLLCAAAVTVVAGMALLVGVPAGPAQQPGWVVTSAEVVAVAGLLTGCGLVLHASRDWLLGLPGALVSVFMAIVLATFAGLTLYLTGFAPATVAGVATSPLRQHVAVALALGGVMAAFLLIPVPWSPYRKVAQPCLTAIAVVAPVLALLAQDGARALRYSFPVAPGLGRDPVLVVASVGGLLAIPLVVASSIEWVSGCVSAGFRLGDKLAERRFARLRAPLVVAVVAWLASGAAGALPGWLGGNLAAWPLVRGAHPDAWVLAAVVTVLAAVFTVRARGRLDMPDAVGTSYLATALLFYGSVAGGVWVFFECVRYLLDQTLPAAVPELLVSVAVFAAATAALWSGGRRRPAAALAGLAACCAVVLVTGFRWPVGALPDHVSGPLVFAGASLGTVLDSVTFLAVAAGFVALVGLGAWLVFLLWAGTQQNRNLDGTPAQRSGYETAVLPLACWALALLGGTLLRLRGGLLVSAFSHPVLPDPVVFTMVAVPAAGVTALGMWRLRPALARAALCVVVAMPVVAFLPFALPASFGPAGRLAVIALAGPLIYGVVFGSRDPNSDGGTERRLGWLAGTSALVIPLLAYLAVIGHVRGSLTGLLTDTTVTAGSGLGAHLRLVLLLPLFLTFVLAQPKPIAELSGRAARSRAFRADIVVLWLRDGELADNYLGPLRERLTAGSQEDLARYACALAARLGRRYAPPRRTPVAAGSRPATGYPRRESVEFALDVARRRLAGTAPSAHDLARARALVRRDMPPPDPGDRVAMRAYDTVAALRCALHGGEDPSGDDVAALVTASAHEIEDAAEPYLVGAKTGGEAEDNLARAREEIDAQLASLGDFQVFGNLRVLLWFAPSVLLDEPPGVRRGAALPAQHPYLGLGASIAAFAVIAAVFYLTIVGVPN